ncbi:type II secretion system F family protein [Candidatus Woesebacteria bacterium]|nr:type II secretion system F family protein [Candidatus Woesebacteria bacterium]
MEIKNISLPTKDKIAIFDNLATMLGAGISILEAVDSLLEDSKGNQKKLLTVLRQDLTQGKQIYSSFERFPNTFDKVTTNIIKASEEAGSLDVTLKDIKKHIQKEMEFLDKVKSAMVYPAVILVVFAMVMILILVFVMPKLASVFGRMNVELPLPTKILMFMSEIVVNNTIPLILGIIGAILGFIFLFKTKRSFVMGIFFSLPIISELVKIIDITRFTRSMALLLSSGLTVTNALELCEKILWRKDMQRLVAHTQNAVLGGRRFSEGLRDGKGLIPMLVIKLVEAGEKTGGLDKAMQEVSDHMDYEVQRSLSALTTLLEPIMLLFIGITVGGMMLSIIAPIYSLIGSVGQR